MGPFLGEGEISGPFGTAVSLGRVTATVLGTDQTLWPAWGVGGADFWAWPPSQLWSLPPGPSPHTHSPVRLCPPQPHSRPGAWISRVSGPLAQTPPPAFSYLLSRAVGSAHLPSPSAFQRPLNHSFAHFLLDLLPMPGLA